MTEEEARAWLSENFDVSRETWDRLELFLSLLREEMSRQNLISKSSANHIWARHVVDSAQLLHLVPKQSKLKTWLDLGTGAGFPGIIAALLGDFKVHLVESRAKRIAFLQEIINQLNLQENAIVIGSRLEQIDGFPVEIISARAFAPLDKLLKLSHRFSTEKTLWLLPKGKNALRELQALPQKHRKLFHVEQSLTDPEAGILVGSGQII
ncbi:16S rRNA (guanine(527)-N(7))-methyltransferase [hydrothermal vent metagenome]|uniref:16S rRNA (Guanine(527)-N(7))-methyltransferase n=1 Tax=hydrothermal vent metagenome TaxID=652676 RepID=A0A3B0S6D7_9ZZZZ